MSRLLTRMDEANVQAEFYMQCRMRNIAIGLEVQTNFGRLDAVIYNSAGNAVCIVECKAFAVPASKRSKSSRIGAQLDRYRGTMLPIYLLDGLGNVGSMVDVVSKHLNDSGKILIFANAKRGHWQADTARIKRAKFEDQVEQLGEYFRIRK